MELNFPQCFSCPICRETLDAVIIDEVALGFMKEPPSESLPADNAVSQYVPMSKRVLVSNTRVWKLLHSYVKDALSPQEFNYYMRNWSQNHFKYMLQITTPHPLQKEMLIIVQTIPHKVYT